VPAAWFETVSSETVYRGFSTVRRDTVRTPSGDEVVREVVEHTSAVAVVPVLADGSVVLLRQYRQPVGRHVLEIPAGKLDVDGESPEEAAQRELAEEVGYHADRIERLTRFENSCGWTDETTTVYLGTALRSVDAPDGFEAHAEEAHLEVVRLPLDAAVAETHGGAITDAKTVIGLLLAAERLG
jgi:8-oxo-dGTP pyrophosphatase MutT (NUDIX family)